MEKVIFLDRDGTLNEEVNYLHRKEDLKLLPGVTEALKKLREAGYKLIVITNQAGVARGYYQEADVQELHQYMNRLLKEQGAGIDAFFYCPHHPEHGIGVYKKACHCRKPETGMFEMAQQMFEIDRSASWMIGDKLIDVEAGRRYGVSTVLVGTGYGAEERRKAEELSQCGAGECRKRETVAQETRQEKPLYDIYAETLEDAAKEILRAEADRGALSADNR